jgi:endo-1,3(4)-beta-glucanase
MGKSKKAIKESAMGKDEVRKSKGLERKAKHDEEVKRLKEKDEEEVNRRFNATNKINYPSLAARRAAAGKYDALGR